jgi:CRISPR-associated endonuclease Csn1
MAAPYRLGIDLGTNSVGWAMIGLDAQGQPSRLIRCGVRVFEAGMEGDIESGHEESRNLKRRQMRSQRRQTARRRRRQRRVLRLLREYGLLRELSGTTPEAIQDTLNALDADILASPWFATKRGSGAFPAPEQVLPYILRASALDEPLPPHYLGRALYHLAQRRGFKSNRKAPPKKDEKPGEVEKGIDELRQGMSQPGSRTLGEYFAHLNPLERRIRQRWTSRGMFQDEFKLIWDAQAAQHPQALTPERRKELYRAIFYQRPLWFPDDLVGRCELEPGEPRAPKYSFPAQRSRLLQNVNNLKLETGSGERFLTAEERATLVQALELEGDHTFARVRKLLGLKQSRFTIERGGEKSLRGNRTTSAFYKIFGERWLEMSGAEHEQVLHDALSIQDEGALKRRGVNFWKLDEEKAGELAKFKPEPDYFSISRKAMEKLLPLLEQGVTYAEGRRELYPERFQVRPPLPFLPRLDSQESRQAVGGVRNPAVTRSVTELRKVVNAMVRRYGKPAEIRIELARDLKRSKKDRQALSDRSRENELARDKAKKRILREGGVPSPRRDDVRKALLWDECGGVCPYTGKCIAFRDLFGDSPQFDIEHIIPRERSFDDSFNNLTLCEVHENRHIKGGRTPWEAYHGDPERWEQILDRVRRFSSKSARAKLFRFQMTETEATEFISKFKERQLNDTRYASRLAAKYVAMLYGGLSDDVHTRRVHVTSGEVTAQLRSSWGLNGILNDGPTTGGGEARKTRDDHRHHAVDAVAIALTDDGRIQQLSRAAQQARERGQRKLGSLEGLWPNFVPSVREEIERVVVSHRVSRKVSGALHEETLYAIIGPDGKLTRRVRKPLKALSKTEVEEIADARVREMVLEKLGTAGGDPKKVFATEGNLPRFVTADGREILVRNVRIEKKVPTEPLGRGRSIRHVASESNHHVEIYAEIRPDGSEGRWEGEVVTMLEAYRRQRAAPPRPVVERNHGPLTAFKFSLGKGEVVECDTSKGAKELFVMRKVTQFSAGNIQIGFAPIRDARRAREMQTSRAWLWATPNTLGARHPRKVVVSSLGEVREAHD